jgi:uncharacterized membrane protein YfcA
MQIVLALLIGLVSGVSGGLFGIGGGIIIVPACIYILNMGQKQAQGTSLMALLLPIGALAVWNYWKSNQIAVSVGLWIAVGFLLGGFAGSKIALAMNEVVLRRVFAGFLVLVAAQLFFKS